MRPRHSTAPGAARPLRGRPAPLVDLLAILFLVGPADARPAHGHAPRPRAGPAVGLPAEPGPDRSWPWRLYDQTQGRLPQMDSARALRPGEDPTGRPDPCGSSWKPSAWPISAVSTAEGPIPAFERTGARRNVPVPGFICPSDPHATAGSFLRPRSATGGRPEASHLGQDGVFAPGRADEPDRHRARQGHELHRGVLGTTRGRQRGGKDPSARLCRGQGTAPGRRLYARSGCGD